MQKAAHKDSRRVNICNNQHNFQQASNKLFKLEQFITFQAGNREIFQKIRPQLLLLVLTK